MRKLLFAALAGAALLSLGTAAWKGHRACLELCGKTGANNCQCG